MEISCLKIINILTKKREFSLTIFSKLKFQMDEIILNLTIIRDHMDDNHILSNNVMEKESIYNCELHFDNHTKIIKRTLVLRGLQPTFEHGQWVACA